MQYLILIKQFVSENQMLLTTALLIGAYFLKPLVDRKAAAPQQDMWDSIKPGTDALYALVHKGVEYAANKLNIYSEGNYLTIQNKRGAAISFYGFYNGIWSR